jgi:hypothetical protein
MDIVEILIACNSISFKIMQVLSSKPYQGKGSLRKTEGITSGSLEHNMNITWGFLIILHKKYMGENFAAFHF